MQGNGTAPELKAKDQSPAEQQAQAQVAFKLHSNVVSALMEGRAALWKLAENLSIFDEQSGWLALGYETKSEWLADPEVGLTQRTYARLVRSWRVLHGQFGISREKLAELEVSKVDIVLPAIQAGARPLQDALDDVQTLGARDLRSMYWGEKKADEEPPTGAQEGAGAAEAGEGTQTPMNGNGPVRASDGAPIDSIFREEGDEPPVIEGTAHDHELEDEDELANVGELDYIRCSHCGAVMPEDSVDHVAAPPVN